MKHLHNFYMVFDEAFTREVVRWRYVLLVMVLVLVAVEYSRPSVSCTTYRTKSGECAPTWDETVPQ